MGQNQIDTTWQPGLKLSHKHFDASFLLVTRDKAGNWYGFVLDGAKRFPGVIPPGDRINWTISLKTPR